MAGGGQQRVRANLYGALLYYLQIAQKPKSQKGIDSNFRIFLSTVRRIST